MTSDTNIVIEGDNTIYQLISSEKMSDNENTNMSIIDLGDCGKKLLDENHLDYLLILKIDTKLDENTAVILNYEVYNPLNNEKLNLSICNDMKIYTYNNYYPSEESLSKVQQLSQLDMIYMILIMIFIKIYALHLHQKMVLIFYYLIENLIFMKMYHYVKMVVNIKGMI